MAVNATHVSEPHVSEPHVSESHAPNDEWRNASVCREHPTHWWFAGGRHDTLVAKAICSGCTVQEPCLDFALSRPDLVGIWAATSANERAAIRREGLSARRLLVARAATDDSGAVERDATPESNPNDDGPVANDSPVHVDLVTEERAGTERGIESGPVPAARPLSGFAVGARRRPVPPSSGDLASNRNELLTPGEAARKLGVTPNTVTRWSRAGKISAIQTVGGHRRFRRSEIERVLRTVDPFGSESSAPGSD